MEKFRQGNCRIPRGLPRWSVTSLESSYSVSKRPLELMRNIDGGVVGEKTRNGTRVRKGGGETKGVWVAVGAVDSPERK